MADDSTSTPAPTSRAVIEAALDRIEARRGHLRHKVHEIHQKTTCLEAFIGHGGEYLHDIDQLSDWLTAMKVKEHDPADIQKPRRAFHEELEKVVAAGRKAAELLAPPVVIANDIGLTPEVLADLGKPSGDYLMHAENPLDHAIEVIGSVLACVEDRDASEYKVIQMPLGPWRRALAGLKEQRLRSEGAVLKKVADLGQQQAARADEKMNGTPAEKAAAAATAEWGTDGVGLLYSSTDGALLHAHSPEASAITTLKRMGYTHTGGVEWRPPIGPAPVFSEDTTPLTETIAAACASWPSHAFRSVTMKVDDWGTVIRALKGKVIREPAPEHSYLDALAIVGEEIAKPEASARQWWLDCLSGCIGLSMMRSEGLPMNERALMAAKEVLRGTLGTDVDADQYIGRPAAGHPIDSLKLVLQSDPEMAWAWQSNIAMPIKDALHCSHWDANMAAARLMRHLFDVDMEAHPLYIELMATADPAPTTEQADATMADVAGIGEAPAKIDASTLVGTGNIGTKVNGGALMQFDFDRFVQHGREQCPERTAQGLMPWSFAFFGARVTHERDDLYLMDLGNVGHHITPDTLITVSTLNDEPATINVGTRSEPPRFGASGHDALVIGGGATVARYAVPASQVRLTSMPAAHLGGGVGVVSAGSTCGGGCSVATCDGPGGGTSGITGERETAGPDHPIYGVHRIPRATPEHVTPTVGRVMHYILPASSKPLGFHVRLTGGPYAATVASVLDHGDRVNVSVLDAKGETHVRTGVKVWKEGTDTPDGEFVYWPARKDSGA